MYLRSSGYPPTKREVKADTVNQVEGSSPVRDMGDAYKDTAVVLEQGMYPKGQFGNLGRPHVSMLRSGRGEGNRKIKSPGR